MLYLSDLSVGPSSEHAGVIIEVVGGGRIVLEVRLFVASLSPPFAELISEARDARSIVGEFESAGSGRLGGFKLMPNC